MTVIHVDAPVYRIQARIFHCDNMILACSRKDALSQEQYRKGKSCGKLFHGFSCSSTAMDSGIRHASGHSQSGIE
ncbi:MAG TPA: hypothetical protein VEC35_24300 [Noviherbaspirillum sp.]|nr:hypothetical protein [Noviherbaspirillum sp.]